MAQSSAAAKKLANIRPFDRTGVHNDDLFWFFNFAATELGEKSNFGTVVALIEGGLGGSSRASSGRQDRNGEPEPVMLPVESDRARRAAKLWRRISYTLGQCTDDTIAVLRAFHTQPLHRGGRGQVEVDYPDGFAGVVLLLAGGAPPHRSEREVYLKRAAGVVAAALAAYRTAAEALLAA